MNNNYPVSQIQEMRNLHAIKEEDDTSCLIIVNLCDQLMADPDRTRSFTLEEKKAIALSADLWNAFIALPEQHPSDKVDFCNAIHTIQRILGWRPMMRKGTLDV